MVLLEGSADEWDEHTHTSGRVFLSNKRTSETRWLWQKWNMNGRLFVRNICDSQQQHWVDQMDLPMRLVSGMASPDQVFQYEQAQQARKLGKVPQPPKQYVSAVQRPSSTSFDSMSRNPVVTRNAHHEPLISSNALHSISHRNSAFSTPNDQYLHRFPFRPEPNHFPQLNPDRADSFRPQNTLPHPPERPDPNLFDHTPDSEYEKSSRYSVDRNRHPPPFYFDPQQSALHNFSSSSPLRPNAPAIVEFHKRPHSAAPRFFDEKQGAIAKRSRIQKSEAETSSGLDWRGKNKVNKSRFASIHTQIIQRSPRPSPAPIISGAVPLSRRSSTFTPVSCAARAIMKAALKVNDRNRMALLHDRDFKVSSNKNGISSASISLSMGDEDYAFEPVVGTSETIEKDYLRLTTAPKPSAVRPPHILKESLNHVKCCWRDSGRDYDWVCRQLKSIRQDYKVQHIENTDVLDVYETHARIALENSDLGEFNTCVAQVQELYHKVPRVEHIQDEFASYRILYNLLVGADEWEQGKILVQLSPSERNRTATRFALRVREAVISGNYHRYFKMSLNPPPNTMISFLLARFQDQIRCRAISAMASAYGPGQPGSLPLSFVINELGWREEYSKAVTVYINNDIANAEETKARMMAFSPSLICALPDWVLSALKFLIGVNACVTTTPGDLGLDRLSLDCKKTKSAGVRMPRAMAKLITHAGS